MSMETLTRAWEILQDAYQAQMEGDYDRAIELYQSSLELHPTAEAHTFLGWSYHFQGRIDEAIAECKRAIEIGIDLDGALALRDGFVDAALEMITPAKKRMGLGRGVQFKRRLIELDGAIVIAFHLRLIGVLQDFPRAGEGLHAHEGLLAQR